MIRDPEIGVMAAEVESMAVAIQAAIQDFPGAKASMIAAFVRQLDLLLESDIEDKEVAALFHEALERRLAWLESLPVPD